MGDVDTHDAQIPREALFDTAPWTAKAVWQQRSMGDVGNGRIMTPESPHANNSLTQNRMLNTRHGYNLERIEASGQ